MFRSNKTLHSAKRRLFVKKYANEQPTGLLSRREYVALGLLPAGGVLLELGCGNGGLLRASATRFDRALGLDMIEERIKVAKQVTTAPNVQFLLGDMDDGLPFREGTVSGVVCVAAFEYVYDPFEVLDEIRRVLVPGGFLLLQVANVVWLPRRIRLLGGRFPSTGSTGLMQDRTWNGGYLHSFTLRDLSMLLNECRFEMIDLASSSRLGAIAKLWPSLFASDLVVLAKREGGSTK